MPPCCASYRDRVVDELAHGPRVVETDRVAADCWEWPQPEGPGLWWVRARGGDALAPGDLVTVARTLAGQVVATDEAEGSAALADAGFPMVRHVHPLSADPAIVARTPVRDDLRLAPLQEATLDQMAALRVAAFPPGHPDHVAASLEDRRAAYARELVDPANPLHPASRSAWLGEELVGTCLVLDSRHFPGFVGPWVQSVARRPGDDGGGAGAAMLVASARAVLAEGGTYLGLAVTHANPARRLYERMGWSGPEMWLHHVPDGGR